MGNLKSTKLLLKACISFLLLMMIASPGYAQQDSSSVEWIKAYFDMPSDHSVAWPGNENYARQDLIGILVTVHN